ncbi:hypothetical protein GA0070613_4012 [Micromonospora inositola]|uniref:Uncharacterized protein n=1 Tax=Micromonospora inositola TaxID=47865 RepID=A0A1C5J5R3_9ACTN|nr:hypothetical protein GA0070613_4012 [Micromonospora inositola]
MHHEMGHALGLERSSSQVEGVYGDDYDMMSAVRRVKAFRDVLNRAAGPGLAARTLNDWGWLHRSRVWQSFPLTSQAVTLAAVNRPEVDGYLAVKLSWWPLLLGPVWVEYRQPGQRDRGLNEPIVLVHRRNAQGGAELAGGRSNRPGRLRAGEEYSIVGAFTVVVRVEGRRCPYVLSSGSWGRIYGIELAEQVVDLAGDVPLETSHGFAAGEALTAASVEVVLGALVTP